MQEPRAKSPPLKQSDPVFCLDCLNNGKYDQAISFNIHAELFLLCPLTKKGFFY